MNLTDNNQRPLIKPPALTFVDHPLLSSPRDDNIYEEHDDQDGGYDHDWFSASSSSLSCSPTTSELLESSLSEQQSSLLLPSSLLSKVNVDKIENGESSLQDISVYFFLCFFFLF